MTAPASHRPVPRRARHPRRPAPIAAVALAVAVVLAGCSSTSSTTATRAVVPARPPVVTPAGVSVYRGSSNPATSTTCATGTASLAPTALPSPGDVAPGSYLAQVVSRGHLVAGVDQNTYLWGYLNPTTNTLQGFDIDMVLQVAQALFGGTAAQARSHVTFKIVANKDRVAAVQSGAVDLVAETMTINPDRQKQVDFSSVYYCAGQRLLVPATSTIAGVGDLAGKRVCAASGSTSIANLAGLALSPKVVPVQVENQTDCLVLLQQGQVDAISTDDTILQGLGAQDPTLKLVGAPFTAEPYGMAISKSHPELTRFVNAVLANELRDGTWAQLCTQDLGANCPGPASLPPAEYQG